MSALYGDHASWGVHSILKFEHVHWVEKGSDMLCFPRNYFKSIHVGCFANLGFGYNLHRFVGEFETFQI